MSGEAEAQVVNIRPKGKWPLLLAIPPQSLSTEKARGVLPAQYSRADAVVNIQNSMLLLAAFTQGRPDLLIAALDDRIHQPYRAPLCPLLPCLQEVSGQNGILGAVLSGAGPSVLMFLAPDARLARIFEAGFVSPEKEWSFRGVAKNLNRPSRCPRFGLAKALPPYYPCALSVKDFS